VDYEIGNPQMFWLLLLAPIAVMLLTYSAWSRRKALAKFGTKPTAGQSIRGLASAIALVTGIALLALASADIRWGKTMREVPQQGLEVVFALDVSRSMLADDARPNRLVRAKQQIADMVGEMVGDRIGLVVFAGEAKQAIPLTNHYNDFRQKLDSVGPDSVSTGGSQLGVAIEAAADAFISKTNEHKTIVLFTDGEDQESKPIELAQKLFADSGLRIFTVGLGDIEKGARIPQGREDSRRFIEHQGQQVWSKLNGRILKQIATQTQAAYIPAGTKRVNMADVYHRFIANVEKTDFESAKINAFIPRFQWFAFPAFVCLLVHGWLKTTKNRNRISQTTQQAKQSRTGTRSAKTNSTKSMVAAGAAAVVLMLLPGIVGAQSPPDSAWRTGTADTVADQINAANELVRQNKNTEAIEAFNAIQATATSEHDLLNYNLAVAHYGNSDFDAAISLLAESAKSSNDRIAADSRYNLGNCHFAKSLPLVQQPEAAIKELKLAVEHYRSAIRLDRKHADARENLERALKLIDQLNQKQQPEQQENQSEQDQEQKNQQQNKDQSEESDQNDQQNSANDSQQADENQEQPDSKQESSGDQTKSSDSESQAGNEKGSDGEQSKNEQAESQQGSASEDQPEDGQQQSQDTQDSQESSGDQQTNGQQQQTEDQSVDGSEKSDLQDSEVAENEGKDPPQGDISAANRSQASEASDKPTVALNEQNENAQGVMSRQEALKLLQAVRDRDMIRRLRQQQLQRSRRVQVEKDW